MKCWNDIIGIRGLCENKSYKYYLDDYGISLKTAVKTADSKYFTGKNLIETSINQAWQQAFDDIKFDGFTANKIMENVTTEAFGSLVSSSNLIISQYDECSLTSLFLSSIKIKGDGSNVVVALNGDEILNEDATEKEIFVREYFEAIEIEIIGNHYLSNISSGTYYKAVGDSGLLNFQVRCNPYSYLCNYADILAKAVIHKAVALIYRNIITSDRINDSILIKKDIAETEIILHDSSLSMSRFDTNMKSAKGLYQIELEKIHIPKPECSCCLECKSSPILKYVKL